MDLLLLSSSGVHGYAPLEHARGALAAFIGNARVVHFVPYAVADQAGRAEVMRSLLSTLGVATESLHDVSDPVAAVEEAEVLFVGGGNSFRLVRALHQHGLIEPIRRRVEAGELRYIGSSAGTNMACPTMRTTNDMPIVQPSSFDALGLVPFQINPHYQDADPTSTHRGETREQRLFEFLEENDVPVLGIREGAWLRRHGTSLTLDGVSGARLFQRGEPPREHVPGDDLSFLLDIQPRFDSPRP
jgi:dipeptidase E